MDEERSEITDKSQGSVVSSVRVDNPGAMKWESVDWCGDRLAMSPSLRLAVRQASVTPLPTV